MKTEVEREKHGCSTSSEERITRTWTLTGWGGGWRKQGPGAWA